jgi:dolichyl-phosphate-mannose-protein mannosyltransferase
MTRLAERLRGRPWLAVGIALLAVGVALRLVAELSWWPVGTTLGDAYEAHASSPFQNELHPAGYSAILGLIGLLTREVAAPVILQHLTGIASALLLWAATRRITRSEWAGLLPAAVVLLDPDFIFLEHSLMSESWFVLSISAGLYASVRALDEPGPYWRWPLLAGAALSLAVTIRTAALPLIVVAVLAMALQRPRSSPDRRASMRSALALAAGSLAVLLAFATANQIFGRGFGLSASPGWYLYARAAQFADCERFTPPAGTSALCQAQPASGRPGTRFYLFSPTSPAEQHFGPFGEHDDQLGAWARKAIIAQPGDYLSSFWDNLRGYWLPGLRPSGSILPNDPWRIDNGLDPQLAFTNSFDTSLYEPVPAAESAPGHRPLPLDVALSFAQGSYRQHLEDNFYDAFDVHTSRTGLRFLRDWQQVFRFNAVALWISTLLVALGLVFGTRRSRIGVLLFGVGGLSLILAPAITANFWGRYTVPMAGPLAAAAAIAIVGLWRARRPGAAES